jgi:hypothetical protein
MAGSSGGSFSDPDAGPCKSDMVFYVLDGLEFESFFNDGDDRKIADPKPYVETSGEFS